MLIMQCGLCGEIESEKVKMKLQAISVSLCSWWSIYLIKSNYNGLRAVNIYNGTREEQWTQYKNSRTHRKQIHTCHTLLFREETDAIVAVFVALIWPRLRNGTCLCPWNFKLNRCLPGQKQKLSASTTKMYWAVNGPPSKKWTWSKFHSTFGRCTVWRAATVFSAAYVVSLQYVTSFIGDRIETRGV